MGRPLRLDRRRNALRARVPDPIAQRVTMKLREYVVNIEKGGDTTQ